jgi:hypothetical protein
MEKLALFGATGALGASLAAVLRQEGSYEEGIHITVDALLRARQAA